MTRIYGGKTMAEEMNNGTGTEVGTETGAEVKTYTQEEVLALLQSEGDKRVAQAQKTWEKKHQKELSLSKLDGDAREKAEKDARIAELEEMLKERDIANNKSELKSVLASRGLSAEFADIVVINDDIEASQANIDKLDRLFKAAVKAEVEKRLAANGGAPRASSTSGEITKEQFKAMPLSQQMQLYKDSPELYKRLTTN
jgi:hypothetical protein